MILTYFDTIFSALWNVAFARKLFHGPDIRQPYRPAHQVHRQSIAKNEI